MHLAHDAAPVVPHDGGPPALDAAAAAYAQASAAANTVRAYRADWADWCVWCDAQGVAPLGAAPALVANYLAHLAQRGRSTSTIGRRVAAISKAHQLAGLVSPTLDPTVRTVLAGIRRTLGTAPQRQATPAVTDDLRAMVRALPASLSGQRDRALLLVGFGAALRRSELCALQIADVQIVRAGVLLTLPKRKTDQVGQGTTIGIPAGQWAETCPARALRAWLDALAALGQTAGALFRPINRHGQPGARALDGRSVSTIVKRAAQAAGLDPSAYSGHSLRAGFATSAAAAGVQDTAIMRQTGHRSGRTVQRYIRHGTVFVDNAAGKVGL